MSKGLFLYVSTRHIQSTLGNLKHILFWYSTMKMCHFFVQINLQINLQRLVINLYVTGFTRGTEHLQI